MIKDINEKDMSDLVYQKLLELDGEVIKTSPTTNSVFPCRVLETPLIRILNIDGVNPILKEIQITIQNFANTQQECMDMINQLDEKMKEINMIRLESNTPIVFDESIKKYKMIGTYEVNYHALYDAFFSVNIRRNEKWQ